MHKNLFAPQTWDLLEKLALFFLYNFHREYGLIKLIRKKLSPKINVKNIKVEYFLAHWSSSKEITYDNELRHVISNNVVF